MKAIYIIIIAIFLAILMGIFITYQSVNEEQSTNDKYPIANVVEYVNPIDTFSINNSATYNKVAFSNTYSFAEDIPNKAKILNYEPYVFSPSQFKQVANTLGINSYIEDTDALLGNLVEAQSNDKTLTYYKDKQRIEYYNDKAMESIGTFDSNRSKTSYKKDAEDFLRTLNIDISKYDYHNSVYLKSEGAHLLYSASISDASLIEFTYYANVDGYNLINKTNSLSQNVIKVHVRPDGTVSMAKIELYGKPTTSVGNFDLKTKEETIEATERNEAILVGGDFIYNGDAKSARINDAQFAYYVMGDKLVPIYILNGDVYSSSLQKGNGQFLLEAIKTYE